MTKQERHKHIQQHITRMPALSTTANKLLEICNDPKTSPNELVRAISLDPVITVKVINLINSVYYSLPNKVSSLSRAIILLGLNTVTNLAISTTILENFATSGSCQAFSMDAFWTHSICVGVTAKIIAAVQDIPLKERETFFVAGLLHDLGKIPLNMSCPNEYARVSASPDLKKDPSYVLENRILGIDHCAVGGMIAEKWRLGHALNDTLCHHHNPDKAKKENRQLTSIIALGNIYANDVLVGPSLDGNSEKQKANDLLDQIGISWSMLADHRETILDELDNAKIFLQV